jgi:Ca2+-binding EF-hand superfamily protein
LVPPSYTEKVLHLEGIAVMSNYDYNSLRKAASDLRAAFLESGGAEMAGKTKKSARLQHIKKTLDDDGDGEIDVSELRSHVLQVPGISSAVVGDLVSAIDVDGDNAITTQELREFVYPRSLGSGKDQAREFAVILHAVRKTVLLLVLNAAAEGTEDALLKAFAKLGKGMVRRNLLDAAGVRASLKALHLPNVGEGGAMLTEKEIDMLLLSLDRNGDGVVSSAEFKVWIVPKRKSIMALPSSPSASTKAWVKSDKTPSSSSSNRAPGSPSSPRPRPHMPEGWTLEAPERPRSGGGRKTPTKVEPRLSSPPQPTAKPTFVREKPNYEGREFQEHVRKAAREVTRKEIAELNVHTGTVKADVYGLTAVTETLKSSMREVLKTVKGMRSQVGVTGRRVDKVAQTLAAAEKKLSSVTIHVRRLEKDGQRHGDDMKDMVKKEVKEAMAKGMVAAQSAPFRPSPAPPRADSVFVRGTSAKAQSVIAAATATATATAAASATATAAASASATQGNKSSGRFRQPRQMPPPKIIRSTEENVPSRHWKPNSTLLAAAVQARQTATDDGQAGCRPEPRPQFPPQHTAMDPEARRLARNVFEGRLAQSVERWKEGHRVESYELRETHVGKVGPRWKGPQYTGVGAVGPRWKSPRYREPRGGERDASPVRLGAAGSAGGAGDSSGGGAGSPESVWSGRGGQGPRTPRTSSMQKHMETRDKEAAEAMQRDLQRQLTEACEFTHKYVSSATESMEFAGSLHAPKDDWWASLQEKVREASALQ